MAKKIIIKNKNLKTTILIRNNYINSFLKKISQENKKIFCIIDTKVKNKFVNINVNKKIKYVYLNCSENIKNFNNYNKLCNKLLSMNIDRKSILVVIGGGTLGDLCGFVASTILRGI